MLNTRKRIPAARATRQRIRYEERGDQLIAHVERRGLFGWRPTGMREVVDMQRAAAAMKIWEARNGVTGGDDTAGFGSRLKKFGRKIAKSKVVRVVVKAHTAPLKLAHKITHGKNSPIRKAEIAMQKAIGKALPITKPFIAVHNKLAGVTHKAFDKAIKTGSVKQGLKAGAKQAKKSASKDMVGDLASAMSTITSSDVAALAEANRRVKAHAIAKVLKSVPAAHKKAVKDELVRKATSWTVKSPDTGITYSFKL